MPLSTGTRLGRYEVLSPLGAGGMGEVFRARDTKLGRDVALKVLPERFSDDPRMLARFETEAKAVAALSHPSILALFDVGEENGVPFAVTELLEGETLRTLVTRGPVPVKRALEIAREIAEGLAAAHEKGIVHRDVKPENLFLTKDGHAKVLDFGLARHETAFRGADDSHSPTLSGLTEAGAVVGTVAYMSPEQARGLPVDHRSDQFSLGAVLYEMLAGKKPFRGDTAADTLTAIIRDEPEPLEALAPAAPVPVRVLVERLLAKEPGDRYDSTRDLARDLATWAQRGQERSGATGVRQNGMAGEVARHKYSRPVLATVALAGMAMALASAYWAGRARGLDRNSEPTPGPELVRLTWEAGFEGSPSVSPDGGSFVYEAGPHGQKDVFLRRVGGENPVNLTKDFAGDDRQPALSPDGTAIAFRSDREGGGIFLMGATGESPRRLADLGYDPAWSPDGKKIVFATREFSPYSDAPSELWVLDVSDGTRRRLYDGNGIQPTWSPTGSRIAFHQGHRPGQLLGARLSISTIPAAGGAPTVAFELPDTWYSRPEWTRTGLLFNSGASGVLNVWKREVDESTGAAPGAPRPVLFSTTESLDASSTPDGRRMLFASRTWVPLIDRLDFDPVRGMVPGTRRVVLSGPRDLRPLDLSPDGEWLAAVLLGGRARTEIFLVRVRTGETRRLTDDPTEKSALLWAPDGSRLYFAVAPEGATEVWSIRPDGSGRQREFRSADGRQVLANVVSPDGRTLHVLVGKDLEPQTIDLSAPVEDRRLEPLPPLPDGRRFAPARFSPDGRWLAGTAPAADGTRDRESVVLFGVVEKTYEALLDSTASLRGWLPDSRRLLLCQPEGPCQVLDRVTRKVSPAGTLGEQTFQLTPPWLSRDGRSLFGSRSEGQGDIWMLEYGEAPFRKARPGPGS